MYDVLRPHRLENRAQGAAEISMFRGQVDEKRPFRRSTLGKPWQERLTDKPLGTRLLRDPSLLTEVL